MEEVKKIAALAAVIVLLIAALSSFLYVFQDLSHFFVFEEEQKDKDDEIDNREENDTDNGNKSDDSQCSSISMDSSLSPEGGKPPHIPLFNVTGAAHTSYLRGVTASWYTGRLWKLPATSIQQAYHGETLSTSVTAYDTQQKDEISIKPLHVVNPGFIPTALYPEKMQISTRTSYYPKQYIFRSHNRFDSSYTFTTLHYQFDEKTLREATPAYKDRHLQIPSEITQRTKSLAHNITRGIENPYEKILAIKNYLQTVYEYNWSYERAPDGWEPNDWFLFEEKKGVCANFNSAFTILLRIADIPSRFVGGYAIHSISEEQTVYADQAHAWSEVHFEQLGWVTFDATGGGESPNEENETEDKDEKKTEPKNETKESQCSSISIGSSLSPEGGKPPHIPLFNVTGATHTSYLRGITASKYTGRLWKLPNTSIQQTYHRETLSTSVTAYDTQQKDEISIRPLHVVNPGFIPIALYPEKIQISTRVSYYPEQHIFRSHNRFDSSYEFTTLHYRFTEETLREATPAYKDRHLQIPSEI
ncbi:MAG: transglutaminase-like domain-containing protein, partial [Thermoplasmatota archaeon]